MTDAEARQRIRTLLDVAGITVEGEDFDAVVRLYQRFGEARERLAGVKIGEAEPMIVPGFHSGQDRTNERR